MSIIANYVRLSTDDLERCRSDREFYRQVISREASTTEAIDLDQFWDAIAWLISDSSRRRAVATYQLFLAAEGEFEGEFTMPSDIPSDPMEVAIKGGEYPIHTEIDLGYGPASVLNADDVRDIHEKLQTISHDQLRANFDPAQMLGVHPSGWEEAQASAVDEMVIPWFDIFRDFIQRAASQQESVIVYFN